MRIKKYKVLVIILFCFSLIGNAQQNTNSPYSYYGIGEFQSQGFAINSDMGGIGAAFQPQTNLNPLNPASLSALSMTTYEMGLRGRAITLEDYQYQQEFFNVNLSYLSLGFPVAKNVSFSAGLMPYTFQGYQMNSSFEQINETDTIAYTQMHSGTGGFNKAFASVGFSVYKGLSVGITSNLLFGTLEQNTSIIMSQEHSFNQRENSNYTAKDFFFNYGAQYTHVLEDKKIVLGASFRPKKAMNSSYSRTIYTYDIVSDFEYIKDTISSSTSNNIGLVLPMQCASGISFEQPNNWMIAAEYNFHSWSQLRMFTTTQVYGIIDASEYKIGGWWIPNYKDVHSYLNTIVYRAGLRYCSGMNSAVANNSFDAPTKINDMSISLGLGLPLKKSNTILNLGLELGTRGTVESNLVKENYLKFHLAFTFNDKWFTRRKID